MSILVGATSGLAGAAGAAGGGGDLGEPINQSVRFAGDSVLHRNFSGGHTSADTGTISFWAKKAGQATEQTIWNRDGDTWHGAITNSDEFAIRRAGVGFENFGTIKYRDPSAWYHYIISINSATATLYVNGVQVPTTRSVNSLFSGGTSSIRIGSESTSAASSNFDGYLAEFIFVDGQALDEEDFGRFNEDGVWVPIEYTGTFGNNGFHLDFADNSDPGNDVSGNNNDFTAVGFETTAISSSNFDNDVDYQDTPTSNYATGNPLDFIGGNTPPTFTFSNANLSGVGPSTGLYHGLTSIAISADDTNTYYMEFSSPQASGGFPGVFIAQVGANPYYTNGLIWTAQNNDVSYNGVAQTDWTGATYSANDVGGFSYNGSTGVITGFVNGVQAGTFTATTGIDRVFGVLAAPQNINRIDFNYGQRNFIYQPANTVALQTNNLPEPTIKNGKEYFGILTYAAPPSPSFPITIDGSGGNNGDGELDFDGQPDLVWMKMRNAGQNNILFDSVRGTSVSLRSDGINSESARTNFAFATNGFTFSAQDAESYQQNDNYVAWCWKAGGTAVSNTNGTITSNVSANTDAGFSIVSYTGNQSPGATVGHGLTTAPEVIFVKSRNFDQTWHVKHSGVGNNTDSLNLDTTAGGINYNAWNNTAPGNSVFTLGPIDGTNKDTQTFIAYCWHSVEGYSKFGSYTGAGSGSAPDYNGTFVYLGFRPSWLLIKRSNAGGDPWILLDSTRDTNNFAFRALQPDNSNLEVSSGDQFAIDFLSNGFKCRSSNAAINLSGASYVYMAFAENPFGGENAPPATAR